MHTPAHLAASLFLWRKEERPLPVSALVIGALLPDLPMFGFYGYQKMIGRSESEIWTTAYFEPGWQLFFDLFNSIPIALVLIAVFHVCRLRWAKLLVGSALLHMCCDLPVHHDDGHRHFLPLSNWRFESPVSYWDPHHFGIYFAGAELLLAVVGLVFVLRTNKSTAMRWASSGTLSIYALAFLAVLFWVIRRWVF